MSRKIVPDDTIDPFRAQHLRLARRLIATPDGPADVLVDEAESPLAWLARRKGRDGQPLIHVTQFQAGERLRGDFTRAQMTPRVTANWDPSVAQGRRGQAGGGTFTDVAVAARQRLRGALDAVGPEFAGLLLDVCCFLKGLEDIERERRWPPRCGKVVVQLGARSARASLRFGRAGARPCTRADPNLARCRQRIRGGVLSRVLQRGARIRPDALDHGAEAVRALRRQVFAQARAG